MPPLRARTFAPRVPTRTPRHAPKRGVVPSAGRPRVLRRARDELNVQAQRLDGAPHRAAGRVDVSDDAPLAADPDGVAQLFGAGPAEADAAGPAGCAGWTGRRRRGRPAIRGWGSGHGNRGSRPAGVPADPAAARQRGEDVRGGVQAQLLDGLLGQGVDLLDEGEQGGAGDVCLGGAVRAAGATRCGRQAAPRDRPGRSSRPRPARRPAFGSGQVHAVLALEASGTAGCTRAHAFREESVRDAYGGQHGDV